jgi:CRISPR-associated protein Csm5
VTTSLVAQAAYSLTPLSPVHVGTEDRLGATDIVVLHGTLHRLNVDALLRDLEKARDAQDRYVTSGIQGILQWLQQGNRLARLTLYACPVPRDPRPREDCRPLPSDPLGRPYIPGTEIKGAIRTALLWDMIGRSGDIPRLRGAIGDMTRRGHAEARDGRAAAGLGLARAVLGDDPRHDLLRILRVLDTDPVPSSTVRVHPVLVAARHGRDLRLLQRPRTAAEPSRYTDSAPQALAVFCECLENVALRARVEIDRFLAARHGEWSGRDPSGVPQWMGACARFSRHVAEGEADWWGTASAPPDLEPMRAAVAEFYRRLLHRISTLPPDHVVMNIGWGGGWRTKTVTELFGGEAVQDAVRQYRLDRGSHSRPFPKTRRIAWLGGSRFAPLGWVLMAPAPREGDRS